MPWIDRFLTNQGKGRCRRCIFYLPRVCSSMASSDGRREFVYQERAMGRVAALGLFWVSLAPLAGIAQTQPASQKVTLTAQGVAGDMDAENRSPIVTVSYEFAENGVKILADAFEPNEAYKQYPLRFDFYINRRLFSSQVRSPELPGAVGVDVGQDVAVPPFNYTVVVQLIHPNRSYATAIQGAVFTHQLTGRFDCTLTLSAKEEPIVFVANEVQSAQRGNLAFSIAFEGERQDGGETAAVEAPVMLSGTDSKNASSTVLITRADVPQSIAMTGTVEVENETIKSFSLSSEDGETTLSCS